MNVPTEYLKRSVKTSYIVEQKILQSDLCAGDEHNDVSLYVSKLNEMVINIPVLSGSRVDSDIEREFIKLIKLCKGYNIYVTFDNVKCNTNAVFTCVKFDYPLYRALNNYDLTFHTKENFLKLFPQVNNLTRVCFSSLEYTIFYNGALNDWFDCGVHIIDPIMLKKVIGCDVNTQLNTFVSFNNNINNITSTKS